jgi:hypothetical protein
MSVPYNSGPTTTMAGSVGPKNATADRMPLTIEINDTLSNLNKLSSDIEGRLDGLKGRLFGVHPESTSGSISEVFSDSFDGRSREALNSLLGRLYSIQTLVAEIDNRL